MVCWSPDMTATEAIVFHGSLPFFRQQFRNGYETHYILYIYEYIKYIGNYIYIYINRGGKL